MNTSGEKPDRQLILQYLYGLLPESESDELRSRLEAEPSWKEAFDEVQRQKELIAAAARWDEPTIRLDPNLQAPEPPSEVSPTTRHLTLPAPRYRWFGWAAMLLVSLGVGGYQFRSLQLDALAERHFSLVVVGPKQFRPNDPLEFFVKSQTLEGQAVDSDVEISVDSEQMSNETLWKGKTGSQGTTARFDIPPATAETTAGVIFRARAGGRVSTVETELAADQAVDAFLMTDRDTYHAGEEIKFSASAVGDNRDRLSGLDAMYRLKDAQEQTVVELKKRIGGLNEVESLKVPADATAGLYELEMKSPEDKFRSQVRRLAVDNSVAEDPQIKLGRSLYAPGDVIEGTLLFDQLRGTRASGTLNLMVRGEQRAQQRFVDPPTERGFQFSLPEKIGDNGRVTLNYLPDDAAQLVEKKVPLLTVDFVPESGKLVAGMHNSVYFSSANSLGDPVPIQGEVQDTGGNSVTAVASNSYGLGRFGLTPEVGNSYSLKVSNIEGLNQGFPLPPPSQESAIKVAKTILNDDEKLDVNVVAHAWSRPKILAAFADGRVVAQKLLEPPPAQSARGIQTTMAFDRDFDGLVNLALIDSESTAGPLAQRYLYRKSDRNFEIALADPPERWVEGEKVRVGFEVRDQARAPVVAMLGISVALDSRVPDADHAAKTVQGMDLGGKTAAATSSFAGGRSDYNLSGDATPAEDEDLELVLGTRQLDGTLAKKLQQQGLDLEPQPADYLAYLSNSAAVRSEFDRAVAEHSKTNRLLLRLFGIALVVVGGVGMCWYLWRQHQRMAKWALIGAAGCACLAAVSWFWPRPEQPAEVALVTATTAPEDARLPAVADAEAEAEAYYHKKSADTLDFADSTIDESTSGQSSADRPRKAVTRSVGNAGSSLPEPPARQKIDTKVENIPRPVESPAPELADKAPPEKMRFDRSEESKPSESKSRANRFKAIAPRSALLKRGRSVLPNAAPSQPPAAAQPESETDRRGQAEAIPMGGGGMAAQRAVDSEFGTAHWIPNLQTDRSGKAFFEFIVPRGASKLHIRVNAKDLEGRNLAGKSFEVDVTGK